MASRSAMVLPEWTSVAPYPWIASCLQAGVFSGTTTCASIPRSLAARATAMPWLPLDCVTTPLAASSSLRLKIALVAPRILKLPVFCRLSHLKCSL